MITRSNREHGGMRETVAENDKDNAMTVICHKKICPYVNSPFPACYCSRMNSQVVERTIRFCGCNYEECDIYEEHLTQ